MNKISKEDLATIAAIIGAIASILSSLRALISVDPLFGWIALAFVVAGLFWYLAQGHRSVWIIGLLAVLGLVSLGAAWWVGPVTVEIATYIDENRNGMCEEFEQTGPAGIEVQLLDSEGVMRVAYTDSGGVATFPGIPQGSYGILRVGPGSIGGNATRANRTAQVAILPTLQPPTETLTPPPTETPTLTPTLLPTPTAAPTNTPTPTPTLAIPDAVVAASVNLRSGSGTMYEIISTLSPGQVLTVTGRIADTTWLQVITDQMQEGWVVNRADLVTLNLLTERIPIVSPPPTPTPSLTPTATPTPTPMSFQNFEPDNGTPPGGGNYFWDAWLTTCSFESTIVHEGSRAVRVDAHAAANGNPGDQGGTMGINPSSSEPIDLSSATTLSVWVYDTPGNNTVQLRLRDSNDTLSNEVWSEMHAEQKKWTEITWPLSDFTDVDLSKIKNIELYERWDGVYYFDAVSWQSLEPITCLYQADTDAETIVRLIQAESKAVNSEDISIIRAIFAEDALIRDAVSGEEWNDPISHYGALFAGFDFKDLTHFDILPTGPGITETIAYYTSGNEGQIRWGDGGWQSLENTSSSDPSTPYGSDHWTLQRNSAGCWVITEFTFNAGHILFPQ